MLISLILSAAFASDTCPQCLPEHTAAPNTHPVREIVETPSAAEVESQLWDELTALSAGSVPMKKGNLAALMQSIGEPGMQRTMLCTQEDGIRMICSSVSTHEVMWVLADNESVQRALPMHEQVDRLKLLKGR